MLPAAAGEAAAAEAWYGAWRLLPPPATARACARPWMAGRALRRPAELPAARGILSSAHTHPPRLGSARAEQDLTGGWGTGRGCARSVCGTAGHLHRGPAPRPYAPAAAGVLSPGPPPGPPTDPTADLPAWALSRVPPAPEAIPARGGASPHGQPRGAPAWGRPPSAPPSRPSAPRRGRWAAAPLANGRWRCRTRAAGGG